MQRRTASPLPATERRLLLIGAALALVAGAAAPGAAAAAERSSSAGRAVQDKGLVTFGIGPAGPERPDQRPYLEYGVQPGSVVLDHVAVVNQSDVPLTLAVYPGDAINSEGGGLDITQRAQRNQDLGSWVTLGNAVTSGRLDPTSRSQTTVTVPPQSARTGRGTVIVPVRIAVPADAGPGDHVGGIATALLSRGANPTSQNIDLEQRVVARVYVRVAGPLAPELSVEVLNAEYVGGPALGTAGTARITYRITNSGNVRLGAESRVDVRGPFGFAGRSVKGETVGELVPGGSAVLTATVADVRPLIRTSTRVVVRAVPAPGAELPDTAVATARDGLWSVTWQQAVALVLLLALLALGLLLRRRRRRRRPGAPGRHGRSAGEPEGDGSPRALQSAAASDD